MPRKAIFPLLLAALSLAGCSDGSNPLDSGSAPERARFDGIPTGTDSDLFLDDVQLRPGVTVDLHLEVFVDEAWPSPVCPAENAVLAVPGFAHTAATWRPYADALFAEGSGQPACALIALDPPGHGGSGLPDGLVFGELTLDDYATALLAALDALRASGGAPATLIGHSQGGIVIQMAQQRLVGAGSSLRRAAGVREIELLAPVPAAEVAWSFVDSGAAAQLLGQFLAFDPVLGVHASVPAEFWPALFFSNLSGQVASGAPTAAQVTANGYNAPAPLFASLQLVGAPPFARPSISAGIFGDVHGTRLRIVVFEQDQLIRPEEGQALLEHLAGGGSGQTFSVIGGAEAVHDLYLSNPGALLRH